MKWLKLVVLFVLNLCLFLPGQNGYPQVRGRALYDLMTREPLTRPEGTFRFRWLPNGQGYYLTERDSVTHKRQFYRVVPETQKKLPLFSPEQEQALREGYKKLTGKSRTGLPFLSFNFVMNGQAITFNAKGRHFLFHLKDRTLRELKRPEVKPQPGSKDLMRYMPGSQLWNGAYSPDYNYFAYVKDYDLYVVDTRTGEEKRLTKGGNKNLLHGRPDWVYPEEFSQLTAYWWSPDSRKLAYYEFDESQVHQYPLVHDLKPEAELELQHYPNPGDPNPTVNLYIADVQSGNNVQVETHSSSDNYIIKPQWRRDSRELLFIRMNRRQNKLDLLAANSETGKVRSILQEEEPCFINLDNDLILLEDDKHFIWFSERTGWQHLYLYDLQGRLIKPLTQGEWPVARVVRVDEKHKWVYFIGYTHMGLETHLFRVKLNGSNFKPLTTAAGSHRISMDPAAKYYTDYYSSFDTPPTMYLCAANGKKLKRMLWTHTEKLDSLGLEPPELVTLKAADGQTDLHGLLFKPAGYDPNKAYPLLVSVYGGPHSKMIRNSYQMNSRDQTLAQLGFMVWKMDNRGVRQRGKKFETQTYLKLGQIDLDDQVAGVKFITRRPYIDGSRVGIFGHSYGGYMTCMALLKAPEVFHVGVAGAPVTDWRNYDTIYTERYMRTPQENPEGYDLGSALKYAKNLKGKLLLIHGSADNNVHPGNTIQLIDALVKAGKRFDLIFYPNQRHGIGGVYGKHYRKLLVDYFIENLLGGEPN